MKAAASLKASMQPFIPRYRFRDPDGTDSEDQHGDIPLLHRAAGTFTATLSYYNDMQRAPRRLQKITIERGASKKKKHRREPKFDTESSFFKVDRVQFLSSATTEGILEDIEQILRGPMTTAMREASQARAPPRLAPARFNNGSVFTDLSIIDDVSNQSLGQSSSDSRGSPRALRGVNTRHSSRCTRSSELTNRKANQAQTSSTRRGQSERRQPRTRFP